MINKVITLMVLETNIIGIKEKFINIKERKVKAIISNLYLTQQCELMIFPPNI